MTTATPLPLDDSTGPSPQTCFHCGLPVPHDVDFSYPVFDRERSFCCAGCHAVCKTIVDNGMDDYYRHRTEKAPRAGADAVPDFLDKIHLYDHPDIQKSFVRHNGESREAALVLEDIRCASCLWLSENHVRRLPGVLAVEADYTSQRMTVRWDPAQTQLSQVLNALAAIGYIAHPYSTANRDELANDQKRRNSTRIIFAAALGMPIMQFSLASYFLHVDTLTQLPLWTIIGRWCMLLAATAVLAFSGQEFFHGAWRDLRNRHLGMDVPIVLGLSVAWLASLHSTVQQSGAIYFDSIAMFVLFVLVSRAYELKGRRKAADLLDGLTRVVPEVALKVTPAGHERVPAVELAVDDEILLRAGETSPVDGTIVDGGSAFDESVLTGESTAVNKTVGDKVIAGSMNLSQPVQIRVRRVGEDTTISEIRSLLNHGIASRPEQVALADRVVAWFVPAIIVLALATAATWALLDPSRAVANTIAVLMVSCPCALALATPVVTVIAAGRLAGNGIVTVDMAAMERLANIDEAVFDKTGTLTLGQLSVSDCVTRAGVGPEHALNLAAALENYSSHPLAAAIRNSVATTPLPHVGSVREIAGDGVQGKIAGTRWRIGRPGFVGEINSDRLAAALQRWREAGLLVVALGHNGHIDALIALQDRLREGAQDIVPMMKTLDILPTTLLSGDHAATVKNIATQLGFQAWHGGMRPDEKLDWLRTRQQSDRRVMMVGDGINDSPTLAAADASFSFADATQLAQYHSDFLLLGKSLTPLSQAITTARRMTALIRQNYAWAIGYNLVAIPLAFSGVLPPWAAAAGMSLSSLIVVANSLRLQRIA